MSKELETLNVIKDDLYELSNYDKERATRVKNFIKQTLSTPTAEDVCKALSEYLNKDISYNGYETNDEGFYRTESYTFIAYFYYGAIDFINVALPPHLITMIGRFYEEVNK